MTTRADDKKAWLGMYDWPAVRSETNAFWGFIRDAIREEGGSAPERLARDEDHVGIWLNPNLLLAQTCGFPYVRLLRGRVKLLATPCYAVDGCDGPFYQSWFIVKKGSDIRSLKDLEGRTVAINGKDSQSGYNSLHAAICAECEHPFPKFTEIVSGGHINSMKMVAKGSADACMIDPVCVELCRRHEPEIFEQLTLLLRGPMAPGLPLITSLEASEEDIGRLQVALTRFANDPSMAETRKALMITGFEFLDDEVYDRIEGLYGRWAYDEQMIG